TPGMYPQPSAEPRYHRLTLAFASAALEREFVADYFIRSLLQMRVALLVGVGLYALFGALDPWVMRDAVKYGWIIRYLIVCPLLLALFALTFSVRFEPLAQHALSGSVLLGGVGIIAEIVLSPPEGRDLYYAGIVLCMMFGYSFARLRFVFATIPALLLTVA